MKEMKLTKIENSSAITHHHYDPKTKTMTVKFASGKTYHAVGVSPAVNSAFLAADSKGGHFNKKLREKFTWSEA